MPDARKPAGLIDRRLFTGLSALALAGLPGRAGAITPSEEIALWPFIPPGGEGLELSRSDHNISSSQSDRHIVSISRPALQVFRPAKPDGSALLIAPGGGYSYEAVDLEGNDPAAYFSQRGVTAFVLTYRLPYEGWKDGRDVPLQDAQRAMRLIRARAHLYDVDPARAGVLGFSAGGHLAASLSTRYTANVYAKVDVADDLDARPSFAALLYPVITMLPPFAHESSVEKLLGRDAPEALRAAYSVEQTVTTDTPPSFLCAAADDPEVPLDNTLAMFSSLRAQKVPSEMHIFESGGHGFGLGEAGKPETAWPDLLLRWGASHGHFRPEA